MNEGLNGFERAFEDLNGALKGHPKPARSFQRSCEALKGWFERPCGAFKGEDGRSESPSNGRLEPLNTWGGAFKRPPSPLKSGSFRSGVPAPKMNPGRGRGGPRGSFGVGAPKRPQSEGAPLSNGALYGRVRPCTLAPVRGCTPMYGDVRPCTLTLVRPCTGMHARPCTGMYGGVRPCTFAPVRRCTEVYARARSAMYAPARRRTPGVSRGG